MIKQETVKFLADLDSNNNRPWFEENKPRFLDAKRNWEDFFIHLQEQLNKTDKIEKYKIYRIYRDVRFSKDKTPYKSHLSGYFAREGEERRGGYYLSLESDGRSHIGGGFYMPSKEDLFRIRKEIELDGDSLKKIIHNKKFKSVLGEIQGDRLKTAPKGFDKEHEHIDLLRLKGFYFMHPFEKEEVLNDDFPNKVMECFLTIRPFFDYMSSVLTTNLNGESIL